MTYVVTDADRLRLLGLNPDNHPSADDIRRAYRRLALRHHPDRGGDPDMFGAVADAYRVLTGGDPARFDAYATTADTTTAGGTSGDDTRSAGPEPAGDGAASSEPASGGPWKHWEHRNRERSTPPPGWFSEPVDTRPAGVKARRRWVDQVGWTIHRPALTGAICAAVAAVAGLLLAARGVIDPAGLVEPLPGEPFRLRFPLPVSAVIALLVGAAGPAGLSWAMSGPGRRKWIAGAAIALLWLEGLVAGAAVVVCFLAFRDSRHRFWLAVAAAAAVIWIGFWPALWCGAALAVGGDWLDRRR